MPNLRKIVLILKGILYGTIDQQISKQRKIIIGVTGLLFAIFAQMRLAWEIAPEIPSEKEKALLNILITPFQLVAIYSLMNITQSLTNYPYKQGSLWNIDKKRYIPFFLRVRGFSHKSYIVTILVAYCLAIYMDYTTNHPNFSFWFIINITTMIVAYIAQRWLKTFMKNFEYVIETTKETLEKKEEIRNYEEFINSKLFTDKEGTILILFFISLKMFVIEFSGGTWIGGGGSGYTFPITPLWAIFTIYTVEWCAELTCCSIIYFYNQFSSILIYLTNLKPKVLLFDPDGYAGLGNIADFIYSQLTKILILISITTFGFFSAIVFSMDMDTSGDWKYLIVGTVIVMDSFALIVFLRPLTKIRSIIKNKKEEEKKLLLERIKQKEEKYLKRNLEINELQEISYTLDLIENIERIPEWGISTQKWIYLFGKVILTFNPIFIQMLT